MPKRMQDALQSRSKSGCPKPCCETPTSIMDADLGLDDDSASIVIVGGGPHALAALAALQEKTLAFQQYGDDSQFEARVGFDSLQKVGTGACVCVCSDPLAYTFSACVVCACPRA